MVYLILLFFSLALAALGYFISARRSLLKQIGRQTAEMGVLEKEKRRLEEQIRIEEARKEALQQTHDENERLLSDQVHTLERFRHLVEDTEEFLFECDYRGAFTYANPVMLRQLGYAQEELSELKYNELVLPGKEEEIFRFYMAQYQTKQSDSYAEWQVINRFGEEMWVGLRVRMTFGDNGWITSVKGIGRDLSIQRNREKQNQEQSKRFDDMFTLLPFPALVFQKTGKDIESSFLVMANKSALSLMNLDWYEVAGIRIEDVSSSLTTIVKLIFAEGPVSDTLSKWAPKNQPEQKYAITAVANRQHILVLLQEDKPIEKRITQLESERDFYRMILDHMPFDLAVFSADERFVYVNPSAVKNNDVRQWMIGKTDSDYMKYRKKKLFHAVLRKQRFEQVRSVGETVSFEELFLTPEKQILHYIRHLRPVMGAGHQIQHFIAGGFNITELSYENESLKVLHDRWLFHSTVSETMIQPGITHSSQSPQNGLAVPAFAGQAFHNFVTTIENFEFDISRDFPNVTWFIDPASVDKKEIYRLPRILIEETIRFIQGFNQDMSELRLLVDGTPESPCISIQTELKNGHTGNHPLAMALVHAWRKYLHVAEATESQLYFKVPLVNQRADLQKIPFNTLQMLEGKRILVGPFSHPAHTLNATFLKTSGAVLTELNTAGDIAPSLSARPFHLVIWWETLLSEFSESLKGLLEHKGIKLLVMAPEAYHIRFPGDCILGADVPATEEELIEMVWLYVQEEKGKNPQDQYFEDEVKLNFEKLAEITNGDLAFMQTLLESYRSSLVECHQVFLAQLETMDAEGLRFLLHKARATIKTFEIRPLENVIRLAIDFSESPRGISSREKKELAFRLKQVCDEAIRQIGDYARENHLAE